MAKKMVFTVISRSETDWHTDQLVRAAKKKGLKTDVRVLDNKKPLNEQLEKCGDIIVWRAASLDHQSERSSILAHIGSKVFINETLFIYPFATHKYFQQNMLASSSLTEKFAIPTYRAKTVKALQKLIADGSLAYPFIAKPNKGAMGKGVEIIRTPEEIDGKIGNVHFSEMIFQNFIENTGDWRIIIVGGRPLGAMKRVAKKGSHLNNISQGATAVLETDEEVLSTIYDIAVKAASLFKLRFTGVDIIRDEKTGEYRILEVNTAPQWDGEFGFQNMTGVPVAEKVVELGVGLANRKVDDAAKLVETYFKQTIRFNFDAALHFASRLWLWQHDDWSRKVLDESKATYIGATPKDIEKTLKRIASKSKPYVTRNQKKAYRREFFETYADLGRYNALLFKVILCESLYGLDLRPYVREIVSDKQFLRLFNNLIEDHDAIRLLSTHAINYFYLLKNYFRYQLSLSTAVLVDPYEIIDLLEGYDDLIANGKISEADALKLKIYLLTHSIIGESRFYQRPVKNPAFRQMLKEIERLIEQNYFKISIDNKCEFLVCAQLCGYTSPLEPVILQEAARSLSWSGNFIIDTLNDRQDSSSHSLRLGEHRNVLYLMASSRFVNYVGNPKKTKKQRELEKKALIGRLARVRIKELGVNRLLARVDTGATSSSIHCSNIKEKEGVFHFVSWTTIAS